MTVPKPAPWSDVPVKNWDELLAATHSTDLVALKEKQGGHRRSSFVFRGMSDARWPLRTSLERLGTPPKDVEQAALRAFGRYAPVGTVSLESEWDRLAVAQHNGLPTRVLDWTASPLVAAHFATEEKEYRTGPKAADGVIWCVNVDKVLDNLLPKDMSDTLRKEHAYVYNVPLLDSLYRKLTNFDLLPDDVLIFFEPPSIDGRIQNQFGILSAMNGPDKSHDAYLRKCSQRETTCAQSFCGDYKAAIPDFIFDAPRPKTLSSRIEPHSSLSESNSRQNIRSSSVPVKLVTIWPLIMKDSPPPLSSITPTALIREGSSSWRIGLFHDANTNSESTSQSVFPILSGWVCRQVFVS